MGRPLRAFIGTLACTLAALAQAGNGPIGAGAAIAAQPELQREAAAPKAARAREPRATRSEHADLPPPTAAERAQIAVARERAGPPKIGFARDVFHPIGTGDLRWEPLADAGEVAAVTITSPEAAALRIGVRVHALPATAALRFYSPARGQLVEVSGEELVESIARNLAAGEEGEEARTWWSPPIESASATMEVELPPGVRAADVRIAVPRISHLVIAPRADAPVQKAAASCQVDATCYASSWNEIGAVARMVFTSGGASYLCTGTLLADRDTSTTIPYFLSASHCIWSQTVASTLVTYWFYRSSTCNGTLVPGTYQQRFGGATLLYSSEATDTAFMRLNYTPPAGAVYAGWIVNAPPAAGQGVTGIHHPTGDLLKISFGDMSAFASCTPPSSGAFSCSPAPAGAAGFYRIGWRSGITEGGSSGSPLFQDGGHYLIGQLYGGSSSCASPASGDFYGRFDVAYNAGLSRWLAVTAPAPPPVHALSVSLAGNGSGVVTSTPAGIDCGATCSASFAQATPVTLAATPAAPYSFAGWSGACGGSAPCVVTMNAAASLTATFAYQGPAFPPFAALPPGWVNGEGGWSLVQGAAGADTYEGPYALKSNPVGHSGRARISYTANFGAAAVTFFRRVSSEPGGDFLRFYVDGVLAGEWSGEVPWSPVSIPIAAGIRTLTWSYEKSPAGSAGADAAWIDAVALPTNTPVNYMLSVVRSGDAYGVVASAPRGIDCGATCAWPFPGESTISLSAIAAPGATFEGWGEACSGIGACTLALAAPATVSAVFSDSYRLRKRHLRP